jgi:hypothetical protein
MHAINSHIRRGIDIAQEMHTPIPPHESAEKGTFACISLVPPPTMVRIDAGHTHIHVVDVC